MHILCTICSDIVSQADCLYVTKCGHLFHHHCLSQWIERSRTCPQCRNQVTGACMWRVYPTAAAAAGEDPAALQARLDDALLSARTASVQRAAAELQRDQLQQCLDNVREQLSASDNRIVQSEALANALREQLTYVRAQSRDAGRLRTECENLRAKLDLLQALQRVVDATADDVEIILEGYSDARTLAVFATAFKRAVCSAEQARRVTASRLAAARAQIAVERARADHLAAHNSKLKALIATEPHGFLKRKSLDAERSQTTKRRRVEPRVNLSSSHDDADTTSVEIPAIPTPSEVSLSSLVARIEESDSPYWKLRSAPPAFTLQSSLVARIEESDSPYWKLRSAPPAFTLQSSLVARIEESDSPYWKLRSAPPAFTLQSKLNAKSQTAGPSTSSAIENIAAAANNPTANNPTANNPTANNPTANKFSIFHNKPRTSSRQYLEFNVGLNSDLSYDGLGGHSKPDTFPEPKAPLPKKSFVPRLTAKHKLSRKPTKTPDIGAMIKKINDKKSDQ